MHGFQSLIQKSVLASAIFIASLPASAQVFIQPGTSYDPVTIDRTNPAQTWSFIWNLASPYTFAGFTVAATPISESLSNAVFTLLDVNTSATWTSGSQQIAGNGPYNFQVGNPVLSPGDIYTAALSYDSSAGGDGFMLLNGPLSPAGGRNSADISETPEPATYLMFGTGLLAIGVGRFCRTRKS